MIQTAAAVAAVFVDFLDGDFVIFKTGLIVGLFNSSFQSYYKTNCDMFLCGLHWKKDVVELNKTLTWAHAFFNSPHVELVRTLKNIYYDFIAI